MTEAAWLSGTRHAPLWNWLGPRLTPRKQILFGCACCRQVWSLLRHEVNRAAVEASERFADGETDLAGLKRAWQALVWEPAMYCEWPAMRTSGPAGYRPPDPEEGRRLGAFPERRPNELRDRHWCEVLRELFGNPFRPPPPFPDAARAWNDGCVVKLASAVYGERDFSAGRMGILADALEEAGVTDTEILRHCREPGTVHVLGCWVLDWITGRR
jgi:hypothetical protein